MDGRMFDGMISGLLIMGAVIGLAIAGIIWLLVVLAHHVHIFWK